MFIHHQALVGQFQMFILGHVRLPAARLEQSGLLLKHGRRHGSPHGAGGGSWACPAGRHYSSAGKSTRMQFLRDLPPREH